MARAKTIARKHDSAEFSYLAAIIDGEGYIGISERQDRRPGRSLHYVLTVAVNITDRPTVTSLGDVFGGNIRAGRGQKGRLRALHVWTATGWQAYAALLVLRPWLRIKRKQASLGIEFQRRKGYAKTRYLVPERTLARRRRYWLLMRRLNHTEDRPRQHHR